MDTVSFSNTYCRWLLLLPAPFVVLAGVEAGAIWAEGDVGPAVLTTVGFLWGAVMVAMPWFRWTLDLEDDVVLIRGTLVTRRIPLHGSEWQVAEYADGVVKRFTLVAKEADGRVQEFSKQGIWTPVRGRRSGRLQEVAEQLNARAAVGRGRPGDGAVGA